MIGKEFYVHEPVIELDGLDLEVPDIDDLTYGEVWSRNPVKMKLIGKLVLTKIHEPNILMGVRKFPLWDYELSFKEG